MSEITLYGIPNCDKVRAARKWLDARGLAWRFFDVREDGLTDATLRRWLTRVPLSELLNRRSTTWRQLSDSDRSALEAGDLAPLMQHPTLLKRPLLETDGQLLVGFDPQRWQEILDD